MFELLRFDCNRYSLVSFRWSTRGVDGEVRKRITSVLNKKKKKKKKKHKKQSMCVAMILWNRSINPVTYKMSRNIRKRNFGHLCPAKIKISLRIRMFTD